MIDCHLQAVVAHFASVRVNADQTARHAFETGSLRWEVVVAARLADFVQAHETLRVALDTSVKCRCQVVVEKTLLAIMGVGAKTAKEGTGFAEGLIVVVGCDEVAGVTQDANFAPV